ncbi:MAG TPA: UDP-N-acetylmuramoyl-L-alanine--D-glutamate ligase [Anaerolineales bacterium]|nr:UDP-N-acetylmuramoyl-L-alanine--D-glutamate ligase [Anaerolineales bacterium]
MKDWKFVKVVIIGIARQGIALARYLVSHGAQVILNDKRPLADLLHARQSLADLEQAGAAITWVCGEHPLEILEGVQLVCVSGGVPLDLPLIVEAQRRGIPLSNDSQIFLEAAPCKVIGITGSAGKTTTTILVGKMALAAVSDTENQSIYRKAWVGGNIGSPLIADVDQMASIDLAVMELSSFQLEIMRSSPHIAAILNVTPNHLDRHGTMQAYLNAKSQILANQTSNDVAVLGRDDPGAWSLREQAKGKVLSFGLSSLPAGEPGAFLHDERIHVRNEDAHVSLPVKHIQLRGEHNLLNVMAACTLAVAAGLGEKAIQDGVSDFSGAPHRLEFVRHWGDADWYNDSIATAPERSMAAIRSFEEPIVLLAGGRDKDLPWQPFAELVCQRVRCLILFGEAAPIIQKALNDVSGSSLDVIPCTGLKEAVAAAAKEVRSGDVVLLSPGGTSFDEFIDFEERGRCFVQWVKDLP